jgi:ABC-type uncharacterized transport system substrate-binding protein
MIFTIIASLFLYANVHASTNQNSQKTWKVLHITSYHMPWEWTDAQFNGFKDALQGLNIEYKILQMNTKRNNSKEWLERVAKEARELIETWHPDLVYTNDDHAQDLVARHYVNTTIPFVFSGVNADPRAYGFAGSKNITGVLEQEHFVQTVQLLKEIAPRVRKVAVILDQDPTWNGVVNRMKEQASQLPEVEFVRWDVISTFDEYKQKIQDYQQQVDAIASLGIFTYKDAQGRNVPYTEVLTFPILDFGEYWRGFPTDTP